MDARKVITKNILLLGPTNYGKTTFINALFNYMNYKTLEAADKCSVKCLIGTKFIMDACDPEGLCCSYSVMLGEDENEQVVLSEYATMACKSYLLNLWRDNKYLVKWRIIDTPGIGDKYNKTEDESNFEDVLNYLSHVDYLDAICIFLKWSESLLDQQFVYCLRRLFGQLDKSAAKNVIYVFSRCNEGTSDGNMQDAINNVLREIENKPPYVHIEPSTDYNSFYFENEAFRYLVALKRSVYMRGDEKEKERYSNIWNKSSQECCRMLDYIYAMNPHDLQSTMSVNNARKLILQISRPMVDIIQLINCNILNIEDQQRQFEWMSNEDLKKEFYLPRIDYQFIKLDIPLTVCADNKCIEQVMVNGKLTRLFDYKYCRKPCYIDSVQRLLIGDPNLIPDAFSEKMKQTDCPQCSCCYTMHMHIYYEIEVMDENFIIYARNRKIGELKEILREIKLKYKEEQDVIVRSLAKFSNFLEQNAVYPFEEPYRKYLEYLIQREYGLRDKCDPETVSNFVEILRKYKEEKQFLDASNSTSTAVVTADDVQRIVEELYSLNMVGSKMKEASELQGELQEKELTRRDITVIYGDGKGNNYDVPEKPPYAVYPLPPNLHPFPLNNLPYLPFLPFFPYVPNLPFLPTHPEENSSPRKMHAGRRQPVVSSQSESAGQNFFDDWMNNRGNPNFHGGKSESWN